MKLRPRIPPVRNVLFLAMYLSAPPGSGGRGEGSLLRDPRGEAGVGFLAGQAACTPWTPPGPPPLAPSSGRALSARQDKVTPRFPWTGGREAGPSPRPGPRGSSHSWQLENAGPHPCCRPGAARGRLNAAPRVGPGHGEGEAARKGLQHPGPVSAWRCAAARPAALRGAAARWASAPSPQRPAGPSPRASRTAPAARARPAARRQQEAGDLRAQRAPSSARGRRERDAGAGLLCPARASPPEGQLQRVQSWDVDPNLPPLPRCGALRSPFSQLPH